MKIRQCQNCGCDIACVETSSVKWCDDCRRIKNREANQRSDARRRPRPVHDLNCKNCKGSFSHSGLGRTPQYCADCRDYEIYRPYRKYVLGTARKSHLKSKYGLTLEQYDELLASQHGCCMICSEKPGKRSMGVDHDHACCPGETSCGDCVRGLLCHRCNVGIGMFNDDPNLLRAAAAYIESHIKETQHGI